MWNARCVVCSSNYAPAIRRNTFGRYNEETGFFELNGLTDVTYEQAVEIMRVPDVASGSENNFTLSYSRARTLFPIIMGRGYTLNSVCCMMPNLEVARIVDYYIVNNGGDPDTLPISINSTRDMFNQTPELREVKGILQLYASDEMGVHFYSAFSKSHKLETIWLKGVCLNMRLLNCKSIRRECWAYMIEYAVNTKAITITVHPDVYSKISDETNEEWHQLIDLAANKNITFVTNG